MMVYEIPVWVGKKIIASKTFKCVMSHQKVLKDNENPGGLFSLSHARKTNKGLWKQSKIIKNNYLMSVQNWLGYLLNQIRQKSRKWLMLNLRIGASFKIFLDDETRVFVLSIQRSASQIFKKFGWVIESCSFTHEKGKDLKMKRY